MEYRLLIAVEVIANGSCLDVVEEVIDEVDPDMFDDVELTCIANWFMAECMGHEVTNSDYDSCL